MKYKVEEIEPSKHLDGDEKNAPMQYKELKAKHPDCILLFRFGDFYETYCEDAETCASLLGVTLTMSSTEQSYRMASFPRFKLDIYLTKLIRNGKRIAICEKLTE